MGDIGPPVQQCRSEFDTLCDALLETTHHMPVSEAKFEPAAVLHGLQQANAVLDAAEPVTTSCRREVEDVLALMNELEVIVQEEEVELQKTKEMLEELQQLELKERSYTIQDMLMSQ